MSDNLAAAPPELAGRLAVGEKLIWWDRPISTLMARRKFQIYLLFGGFFMAFSIF